MNIEAVLKKIMINHPFKSGDIQTIRVFMEENDFSFIENKRFAYLKIYDYGEEFSESIKKYGILKKSDKKTTIENEYMSWDYFLESIKNKSIDELCDFIFDILYNNRINMSQSGELEISENILQELYDKLDVDNYIKLLNKLNNKVDVTKFTHSNIERLEFIKYNFIWCVPEIRHKSVKLFTFYYRNIFQKNYRAIFPTLKKLYDFLPEEYDFKLEPFLFKLSHIIDSKRAFTSLFNCLSNKQMAKQITFGDFYNFFFNYVSNSSSERQAEMLKILQENNDIRLMTSEKLTLICNFCTKLSFKSGFILECLKKDKIINSEK